MPCGENARAAIFDKAREDAPRKILSNLFATRGAMNLSLPEPYFVCSI
jgi:hypothetical protein